MIDAKVWEVLAENAHFEVGTVVVYIETPAAEGKRASAELLLSARTSQSSSTKLNHLRSFSLAENDLMIQHTVMHRCWMQQASNPLHIAIRLSRPLNPALVFKRRLQDVSISRTGKPIIRIQGGR